MGKRTGRADLPLHGGRVPKWLYSRMARLGRVVVEALVLHYGRPEVLRRLSHPFWFQSLGCVMGMDWHSSGITTSVVGALERALDPQVSDVGIHVCGGRGKKSRETPAQLHDVAERTGLDGDGLARTSRLVAKVDNVAVQDGFQLYLHAFFLAEDGAWVVVQQGMDPSRGVARRYHWLSEGLEGFLEDPHAAVAGEHAGDIINLADARATQARSHGMDFVRAGPERTLDAYRRATGAQEAIEAQAALPHLFMPEHHDVRPENLVERRLFGALAAAEAAGPEDFESLLLTPGLGARTVAALALVSEVVHGAPSRFSDPARFSMAHGGKDGHQFPVPLRVYDQTLGVYRRAVDAAKLGRDEKLEALRRLDREARRLERYAEGPVAEEFMVRERARSKSLGGRMAGPAPSYDVPAARNPGAGPQPLRPHRRGPAGPPRRRRQLGLPGFEA